MRTIICALASVTLRAQLTFNMMPAPIVLHLHYQRRPGDGRRRLQREQPMLRGPSRERRQYMRRRQWRRIILLQRTGYSRRSRYRLYIRHILLGRPIERERRMRMLNGGVAAGRRRCSSHMGTEILMQNVRHLLHSGVRPRRTRIPLIHQIGRIHYVSGGLH